MKREASLALLGLCAADTAAHSMNSLGPFAVSALIGAGRLSIAQAGLWSSLELLFYAGAMFGVAPFTQRVDLRRMGVLAALCVVLAQGLSAVFWQVVPLMGLRCLSGFGLGLLNACVNIGSARTGHPARALSLVMVVQTVAFTAASVALPVATRQGGVAGVFLVLAGLVACAAFFLRFLPGRLSGDTTGARATQPVAVSAVEPWVARVSILAVVLYTAGSLCVWSFTAHIADRIGISGQIFGRLSAIANILGLLCGVLSASLGGRRIGGPILVGAIAVSGIACWLQASPPEMWVFVAAYLTNYALWFLVYPSLISLTCRVDPSGRLATLASASWILSQATATAAAGFLARQGAFALVGKAGFLACVVGAIAASAVIHAVRAVRA